MLMRRQRERGRKTETERVGDRERDRERRCRDRKKIPDKRVSGRKSQRAGGRTGEGSCRDRKQVLGRPAASAASLVPFTTQTIPHAHHAHCRKCLGG